VNSSIRSEVSGRSPHRRRWGDIGEAPWSRAYSYRLIHRGDIISVLLLEPGCKRGRRLLDFDSVDRFLEDLAKRQQVKKAEARQNERQRPREGLVHTKALVGDEPGSRQALEREVGALVGSAKDLDQLTFLKSLLRKAYESIVAPPDTSGTAAAPAKD
jgi:hypothetical protein